MTGKSIYTESLGRSVANKANQSVPGRYHVVSSLTNRWIVVADGSVKPLRSFLSQKEAVSFAKQRAAAYSPGEVVIFTKDGTIENRISM